MVGGQQDSWKKTNLNLKPALINGLIAGVVAGVLVLAYALVVGTINETGVNMRVYLSSLSSDSVNFFLFSQSPITGGLYHVAFSTVAALAGSLLAFGAGKSSQKVKEWRSAAMLWSQKTWLGKLQSSPYISYVLMGVVLYCCLSFYRVPGVPTGTISWVQWGYMSYWD